MDSNHIFSAGTAVSSNSSGSSCAPAAAVNADTRIAVVGIGGVGGYIGAMLAHAFPHVSFAARGARIDALKQHGLLLRSDHSGTFTAHPEHVVTAAELGPQDFIFVCVKNYSLPDVCASLNESGALTDSTIIIPVMNGVDPGDRMRALLKKGTVVDSLIYIVAFAGADGSVTQQDKFADLRIGIENASPQQLAQVRAVSALLDAAHIDHRMSNDIEADIWRKYILNCAYNVLTARYDNTIGQLRDDPVKAKQYEALVNEALQVALAKGVHVTQKDADNIIRRFYHELAWDATSSLQRDVRAHRKAELDTFSGYLVNEAKRLGVPVPVSEEMYETLKPMCADAQ